MTAQLTAKGGIPQNLVDKASGLVKYYDVPSKSWKKGMPVDVKEMLSRGTATLTGPLIEMTGPAGDIMVPSTQVGEKLQEGYTVKNQEEVDDQLPPEDEDEDEEEGDEGQVYDFNQHTVDQLRGFATTAGIENANRLNKADLIAALDQSGFDPTQSSE